LQPTVTGGNGGGGDGDRIGGESSSRGGNRKNETRGRGPKGGGGRTKPRSLSNFTPARQRRVWGGRGMYNSEKGTKVFFGQGGDLSSLMGGWHGKEKTTSLKEKRRAPGRKTLRIDSRT